MSRWLFRVGSFAVRHRRLVVLSWVVTAVVTLAAAGAFGGELRDEFRIPGAESQQAYDLLEDRFTDQFGARTQIVLHDPAGIDEDAAVIDEMSVAVAALDSVASISPAAPSPNGTTLLFEVISDGDPSSLEGDPVGDLDATLEPVRAAGIQAELGGDLPRFTQEAETGLGEVLGLLMAVVILLLAFGSVLAMGLPIGIALFGLLTGTGLITLVASVTNIGKDAPTLSAMIGLGVGIDYALFVVTRHRQFLKDGLTVEAAAARANATSGQAVVFAGGTVVIAILGLAVAQIPFVTSMGIAAAMVVAIMVMASVTLLPALLGMAGMRLAGTSLPWQRRAEAKVEARRRAGETVETRWHKVGSAVAAKPWRYLIGSVTLLLVLTAPVLGMRLGMVDASVAAEDSSIRKAYDLVTDNYVPGLNGPLVVVVDIAASPDGAVEALASGLQADPAIVPVPIPPFFNDAGDTATIMVIPFAAPMDESTSQLVHRMREEIVPASGATAFVGGTTASFIDMSDHISKRTPLFIGAVVGLSAILLLFVFRSILVPIKAALMNLLSIGAAYGVIVAVFQWGWGKDLIGLEETIPIVPFIPMFMFAILFGLSMDYEVFLLSRVREEYLAGRSNTDSVVEGLAATARVITSAALIMISVFFGFVLGDNPIIKMMGLGLATAVFVDATIVRVVVVPASMRLMGDANWWLPKWLDRILPNLDIEGDAGLPAAEYRMPHPSTLPLEPVPDEPAMEVRRSYADVDADRVVEDASHHASDESAEESGADLVAAERGEPRLGGAPASSTTITVRTKRPNRPLRADD